MELTTTFSPSAIKLIAAKSQAGTKQNYCQTNSKPANGPSDRNQTKAEPKQKKQNEQNKTK